MNNEALHPTCSCIVLPGAFPDSNLPSISGTYSSLFIERIGAVLDILSVNGPGPFGSGQYGGRFRNACLLTEIIIRDKSRSVELGINML